MVSAVSEELYTVRSFFGRNQNSVIMKNKGGRWDIISHGRVSSPSKQSKLIFDENYCHFRSINIIRLGKKAKLSSGREGGKAGKSVFPSRVLWFDLSIVKLLRDIFYSLLARTPYDLWIFRFGILFEAGKNIHIERIGGEEKKGVKRLNTAIQLPPLTRFRTSTDCEWIL